VGHTIPRRDSPITIKRPEHGKGLPVDTDDHLTSEAAQDRRTMTCATSHFVALVGRRDEPTDGLRDYCDWLAKALGRSGVALELVEVNLDHETAVIALVQLSLRSKTWKGRWVLMQYTALSWSRRGFPFAALAVVWVLNQQRARTAIVFHDSEGSRGDRTIDRIRRACQHWIMRQAYRLANRSIFTIPFEHVEWLPKNPVKATFIPIGANIPGPEGPLDGRCPGASQSKTVVVFGITGGDEIAREVRDITCAMRYVSEKHSQLRLVVVGRNSTEAETSLRRALQGTDVVVDILGVIPAREITRSFLCADVLLFVRGPIAATRGSAIAGIACGLPIIGYAGPETGFPITEAGLQLVPYRDRDALAVALDRVLSNYQLRQDLRWRSLRAYSDYFSWEKIAERYVVELTSA